MMRTMTPKNQVDLIARFLQRHGCKAQRTAIQELVAQLSGAKHWNAFRATPQPDLTPLAQQVQQWLLPLATPGEQQALLQSALPAAQDVDPLLCLFLLAASGEQGDSLDRASLERLLTKLRAFSAIALSLEENVNRALGHNQVRPAPEHWPTVRLFNPAVYDDETGLSLLLPGEKTFWEDRDAGVAPHALYDEGDEARNRVLLGLAERLCVEGIVTEAVVEFPRADHYGVPEEATDSGAEALFWNAGYTLAPGFLAEGTDRGDDGAMSCRWRMRIPPELLTELETALKG